MLVVCASLTWFCDFVSCCRPLKNLGAGDTHLMFDVLDEDFQEGLFERVRDEVEWHKMFHKCVCGVL